MILRSALPPPPDTKPPDVVEAARDPANVFGRYVRLQELGRGGFGTVWKGWDAELGRPVALKLLTATDPDDLDRFRREARLAASLSHPAIAPIYEFGEKDGRPFLAMAFVDGVSADKLRPDPREAARIVRDAAQAVHAAHRAGVLHRDLKPSNLMVDRDGRVFVMDFGIARRMGVESSISQSGIAMGTPAYMSPEQARGKMGLGPAADVWGLGATLYDLLAGIPPFGGGSVPEVLLNVIGDEPIPVRRLRREVPCDLETIVRKCLEKDPARRYASAAELAEDLERFLAGDAIAARPPSMVYRLARRVRKNPWAWGLGTAVVVALAVVSAVFALRYAQARALLSEARKAEDRQEWQSAHGLFQSADELWSSREAVAGLQRTSSRQAELEQELARRRWEAKLLSVYEGLVRRYAPLLEELEAMAAGVKRSSPERAQELVRTMSAAAAEMAQDPERASPARTILAWAQLTAGDQTALGPIEAAANSPVDAERLDPFPHIYLARWCLKEYLSRIEPQSPGFGLRPLLNPVSWPDSPETRELAGRAERHLQVVEGIPLSGGAEMDWASPWREWAHAVRQLIGRDYEGASARLDLLRWTAFEARREARWLYALGRLLGEHVESARAEWLDLAAEYPDWAECRRWIGLTYMVEGQEQQRRAEDPRAAYETSVDWLTQAIEAKDDAAYFAERSVSHYLLAQFMRNSGEDPTHQLEASWEDADEAISRPPELPQALNARALASCGLGEIEEARGSDPTEKYDSAIDDLSKALRLQPGRLDAAANRGMTLRLKGDWLLEHGLPARACYDQAIADLTAILRTYPGRAEVHSALGGTWHRIGELLMRSGENPRAALHESLSHYDRALEEAPDSAQIHMNHGNALAVLAHAEARFGGDPAAPFDRAVGEYATALRIDPNLWMAHVNRAMTFSRFERWAEALAELEAAYRIVGDRYPPLRGWIDEARRHAPLPPEYR